MHKSVKPILLPLVASSLLFLAGCSSFWDGSEPPPDDVTIQKDDQGRAFYTNQTGRRVYSNPRPRRSYHGGSHRDKSYHFSGRNTPVNHKDRDANWVSQQSPNGYTVELGTSNSAADVAKRVQKSPKDQRRAQYKYNQNGQTVHRGVYGTYNSKEEAQAALNKLPADVRQNAKVQSWGSIQKPTPTSSSSSTPEISSE